MIVGLGRDEVQSILAERSYVEVGCEFCGLQYRFDPIDVAGLFLGHGALPPAEAGIQ